MGSFVALRESEFQVPSVVRGGGVSWTLDGVFRDSNSVKMPAFTKTCPKCNEDILLTALLCSSQSPPTFLLKLLPTILKQLKNVRQTTPQPY